MAGVAQLGIVQPIDVRAVQDSLLSTARIKQPYILEKHCCKLHWTGDLFKLKLDIGGILQRVHNEQVAKHTPLATLTGHTFVTE